MNGGMRSCFKLYSKSILSNLKQNVQPEMAKQRLYSTFLITIGPKVNNFKSILDRSFSSSSVQLLQFSTEIITSPVEKKLLAHVEQEIVQPQGEEKSDSKVCGFDKTVDGSFLIFSKYLPNEKISVTFNTNHHIEVEDHKQPIGNETDGEPFRYKVNPNFRVEIIRKRTSLGFDCILTRNNTNENHIQDDRFDDGYVSAGKYDTSSDAGCNQKTATSSEHDEKSQPRPLRALLSDPAYHLKNPSPIKIPVNAIDL